MFYLAADNQLNERFDSEESKKSLKHPPAAVNINNLVHFLAPQPSPPAFMLTPTFPALHFS